jgi:hypothetical protein
MDSKLKKVLEKLLKHAPTQPLLYLFCSSENTSYTKAFDGISSAGFCYKHSTDTSSPKEKASMSVFWYIRSVIIVTEIH